jgi:hypothetical protein
VLLCIAHDPRALHRDIAGALDITERSAYGSPWVLGPVGAVTLRESRQGWPHEVTGEVVLVVGGLHFR